MKCKNCNSEIVDGSKLCENCGQAVDGDNNIKETQRFRKFSRNNEYINNVYGKNISLIYDRITIYHTMED